MGSKPHIRPSSGDDLPDQPVPLNGARGHGIVAERLVSVNGLISLIMLSWSLVVLRRPTILHRLIYGFWRRFPLIVGSSPPD
jgi:hypothetical protein